MQPMEQLEQQLERLQTRPSQDREIIDVQLPVGHLYCPLAMVDKVGCAAHQVSLEVNASFQDLARIREVARQLSEQVRYLLEPLALLEVDPEQFEAQLRSSRPQQDATGRRYYELLVSPRGLRLQRYSAPRGMTREPIPMQLTHEVLRQLIRDFTEAAARLQTRHSRRP